MLKQDNTAIILIDVQGKLAEQMHKNKKLYKQINLVLASAKALDLPIIWVEQLPEKLGSTRPEIMEHLQDLTPVSKHTFSAHLNDEFMQQIEDSNCQQFLLMGIEAHVCVFQTAMGLLTQGKEIHLLSDAVSSRDKKNKAVAINRLQQNGAIITSSEMALFELMETTEHPQFKNIIKLIK